MPLLGIPKLSDYVFGAGLSVQPNDRPACPLVVLRLALVVGDDVGDVPNDEGPTRARVARDETLDRGQLPQTSIIRSSLPGGR